MKWIALLASFFVLTGSALAAGSDDQYLDIYNHILQGDSLLQSGQNRAAAERYTEAQAELLRLQADHPDWNPQVVKYRLDYLASKLKTLAPFAPSANAPSTNAPSPAPTVLAPTPPPLSPDIQQEMAALQERIRSLTDANSDLSRRLKEALSVQPAGASSADMTRAQQKILALQKEKDLLTVTLEQERAAHAPGASPSTAPGEHAEVVRLKDALADSDKKLAEANSEIDSLRAARSAPVEAPSDATQVTQERDKLKAEVAQLSKDLADSEAHQQAAPVTPAPAPETAPVAPAGPNPEVEQLQARLAVLEAQPVPLTPEETAILKEGAVHPTAAIPVPVSRPHHVLHSSKDLPPGAGPLMADAARASMERDYNKAEQKYLAVLSEDENNVYVLTYLANAQYAAGHLDACEKTVRRALALDPEDPATLFLLGILRYRQNKLDAAFDALSRSAEYNPTNAGTQNFLGCVLADKGLKPAAETALRKALQVDPDYADAHYNLALLYASEKPPSPELARWHYKRALDLGHPKSPNLEKLLPQDQ